MSEAGTSSTTDEDINILKDTYSLTKTWKDIKSNVYGGGNRHNTEIEDLENNEEIRSAPTMVFSVIGDSDSLAPRPWPKTVFQTALIEAAKSGGETWILFRDYQNGVSKIVRDAYHYYGVMELGEKNMETPINHVNRHIKLISIAGRKGSPLGSNQCYTVTNEEGDKFLLRFETFVSEQTVHLFGRPMGLQMPVPIAIIVCEGDMEAIAHVSGSLKNKLPVIIIKGSGKAADLILDYLENIDCLEKKAGILFGISVDDSKYKEMETNLKLISQKRNLIRVFDVDHDDPLMLSSIIGEAVVGCWSMEGIFQKNNYDSMNKENRKTGGNPIQVHRNVNSTGKKAPSQRKNTKSINVVGPETKKKDVIQEEFRQYVFNPQFSTPTSLPLSFYFGYQILHERNELGLRGHTLLLEALKGNRCDYVRVLLDQNVDIEQLNFAELYEQTVACQKCSFKKKDCLHMQWFLKQTEKSSAKTLCHKYKKEMERQRCDKQKNKKGSKKDLQEITSDVHKAARTICHNILDHEGYSLQNINISDILLWSIFANRKELAEICWLKGHDHLMTGLLSSAILKKLSDDAYDVNEHSLSVDLREHSRLFEQRCLTLMDRMSEENRDNTIKLMKTIVHVWGIRSSPQTFAYENDMLDVVAHPCSQRSVRDEWYNDLTPGILPFMTSAWKKKKKFITAPITRYILNYLLFLTMLIMYSAFVLTSVSTKYYEQNLGRIFEYYVYFWGAGDLIEEVICCFGCLQSRNRSHRGYRTHVKRYFSDFWNRWDILSHALLIAALFVRHFYVDETFTIARRMFALSLLVMYLRFLEVFLMFRKIGLTIIMIKEMLSDLINFLAVAFFVVVGVGIYFHANLWPDDQLMWSGDWTDWRIWTIVYYPYWQLYAEMNMGILEGKEPENCTFNRTVWETDPSQDRCSEADWTVQGIAAVYLLFSNLLLVNLVIAKFSYTFEKVQENSEKIWHFEKYKVLADYEWRIPSPVNIFFLPYRFVCRQENCWWKLKEIREIKMARKMKKKENADIFLRDFQKVVALKICNKL